MGGIPQSDEVRLLGDAGGARRLALYRADDRLVGALGLDMQSKIMKLRALIKRRTTWGDAMEFCEAKLQDLM